MTRRAELREVLAAACRQFEYVLVGDGLAPNFGILHPADDFPGSLADAVLAHFDITECESRKNTE